jgi:uncharacterized membrane protein
MSSDDRALLAKLDADDTLYRDVITTFHGRMRWLNIGASIVGFALFAIALFCAWRFVTQGDLRAMMLWGAGTALAVAGLALIKIWFWMEIQKNAIVRELKRVELQVANLAKAMAK